MGIIMLYMNQPNQSFFTKSPIQLLQYASGLPDVAIINYLDQHDTQWSFIGQTPVQTIQTKSMTDVDALTPMINQSIADNDGTVWVIATTYEWGAHQLHAQFQHMTPHAIYMQFDRGGWLNHRTQMVHVFGETMDWLSHDFTSASIALPLVKLNPKWTKAQFSQAIADAQSLIKEGDIYQINLSYPCTVQTDASCSNLFSAIIEQQLPHCSGYISTNNTHIASFSPEEFFITYNGTIRTRPIKGTIGRHENPALDAAAYDELKSSTKDHAELVMITDLLRNDLGRCAIIGSVNVDELCQIHGFDYVYHLVSTITAKLKPELSAYDALRLLAPGGSITGCPKISACKAIQSIEDFSRQFYTGHMGFVSSTGDAAFNVAIRTCYQEGDAPILAHTGCGITIDSDANQEFQESVDKLRFVTDYVPTHLSKPG
jgi:para-aminobenzoate synthetase component 1